MKKMTKSTKISDVKREWYFFDADKKILGRLAKDIALKLMGKDKPYFVRNLDCGNSIVVVNAEKVSVTGKKETTKLYTRYSGFPGGLKKKPLSTIRVERPEEIIRHAVYGMLPKNKLRDRLIIRLYVYKGDKHPYQTKFSK